MCVEINQRQRMERHEKKNAGNFFIFALYFRLVVILSIAHSKKKHPQCMEFILKTLCYSGRSSNPQRNVEQNGKMDSNNTRKKKKRKNKMQVAKSMHRN